ncbi:MAG: hypothetical protein JF593_00240 [Novosphingobium sp.]|nr:hypothetical protein [Novosphingobium sp.]
MRAAVVFGLAALIPAFANAGTLTSGASLIVALCTGDGAHRKITVPLSEPLPLPAGTQGCCAKGCHAGSSRKRANCCE